VTRLHRIAREGVSLPTTNGGTRTAADWLGDSDTPNCVSEHVMQEWLKSMVPATEYQQLQDSFDRLCDYLPLARLALYDLAEYASKRLPMWGTHRAKIRERIALADNAFELLGTYSGNRTRLPNENDASC